MLVEPAGAATDTDGIVEDIKEGNCDESATLTCKGAATGAETCIAGATVTIGPCTTPDA